MQACDAIVLGYPNYCGTIPMAVATFLEAFDFTGKKLLPYCTNEGSGMGRSEKDLRKLCPTAVIAPGLAITGSAAAQSQAALVGWMREFVKVLKRHMRRKCCICLFVTARQGFPPCGAVRKRTDEGQLRRCRPQTGSIGKRGPHPALRGHLPPRGKAWRYLFFG